MARRSTASGNQAATTTTDPMPAQAGSETGEAPSIVEQAQEASEQVSEQVQETVLRLSDTLRQQAVSRLAEQKEKAAGGLETMSLALRTAGSEVRRQDNPLVAQYIEGAAGRLESLSSSLRENEVDQLTLKVEQVARQRPTLFLTATLGLGMLASRLFKTSSRNQAERDRERQRREEERQQRLREEEERQRAAAERQTASDAESVGRRGSELGGYEADQMVAPYAVDEFATGSGMDDALAGVPPAPGYTDEATGRIDEDALTSALLDPTGLGVDTVGVPYDAEDEALQTSDPGRERS